MMGFRVDFDGVASAEVARLLHAVEGGLNRHFNAQAQSGEPASGASETGTCPAGMDCGSGKSGGDQPHAVVLELMAAVAIAFFVGVFVGLQIGKRTSAVPK